ncbi:MAG: hypothetical protein ACR2PG_12160 [Hyphomicrobiaceae bacterium]
MKEQRRVQARFLMAHFRSSTAAILIRGRPMTAIVATQALMWHQPAARIEAAYGGHRVARHAAYRGGGAELSLRYRTRPRNSGSKPS